jgi:hypothetical protein
MSETIGTAVTGHLDIAALGRPFKPQRPDIPGKRIVSRLWMSVLMP